MKLCIYPILVLSMFLLTFCFWLERVVDYDIKGCEGANLFCMADYPYTQEEVGDSVVPYHRYFIMEIKNNDEYGIYLPKDVKEEISAKDVPLVDEHGEEIEMTVILKDGQKYLNIELNKITFEPSSVRIGNFYITVLTPSIPSYEIEFKFKKKDGKVYVFGFKMNQEINHRFIIIPLALLAGF